MARTGRPPKPTELKIIQGTFRKDRATPGRPMPEVEIPSCPAWLGRQAKMEWKRITPHLKKLGLISQIDRSALAAYCQAYHRWWEAETLIKEHGLTFTTDKGYVQQRPEVGIASSAMKQMRMFLTEFGLTPSSRTRITAAPAAGSEKDDPADASRRFLYGGS